MKFDVFLVFYHTEKIWFLEEQLFFNFISSSLKSKKSLNLIKLMSQWYIEFQMDRRWCCYNFAYLMWNDSNKVYFWMQLSVGSIKYCDFLHSSLVGILQALHYHSFYDLHTHMQTLCATHELDFSLAFLIIAVRKELSWIICIEVSRHQFEHSWKQYFPIVLNK